MMVIVVMFAILGCELNVGNAGWRGWVIGGWGRGMEVVAIWPWRWLAW